MVDGVLLLVDASEGPLPQTRFVLRKALESRLPVVLVVNKIDRPDARAQEVVDEVYELFLDLGADESPDRVPDRLRERPRRKAGLEPDALADDLRAADRDAARDRPGAEYDPAHPLQALVTNLDASPYVGRLALCRICTGRSARASRSRGAAPTARSRTRRSPSFSSPRRSTAFLPTRPARARSSRSRGCPR